MYREKLNLPEVYNSNKDERGVALIEAAITVPVVVVLLLGVIHYGYLLAGYISLRSASAVTARYVAIINPGVSDDTIISNVAKGALSPELDPNRLITPVGLGVPPDPNLPAGSQMVTLSYSMPLFFSLVVPQAQNCNPPYPSDPKKKCISLSAVTVMR